MNKICLSLLISLCVSFSDVNAQRNYCQSMSKPGKPDIFITISYEIISIYIVNTFYYQ